MSGIYWTSSEFQVKNAVHCTDIPQDGVLEVQYMFKHEWAST